MLNRDKVIDIQPDTILIELVVTACQMKEDHIWMQGDLELRFNGKKPYSDSDIIDVGEFMKSIEGDGEYSIFSCCCGDTECRDWVHKIKVIHSGEYLLWTDPNKGQTWRFDKQKINSDLENIRQELKNYKRFFKDRGVKYIGVGYDW